MSELLNRTLKGLRQALAVSPNNAPLRLQVAEILAELGRDTEAQEAAEAALGHADSQTRVQIQAFLDRFAAPPSVPAPADLSAVRRGGLRALSQAPETPQAPPASRRPRVNFADVGGLDALKDDIRMRIVQPFQKPEIFKAYGKKQGGGILLYGPPGCGKTLLARATAGEVGADFISVSIDQVLDMWFGQSEQHLAALFEDARRRAPCVLFFDEVEALGGSRQLQRNSPGRTLVNQLLAEMDGLNSNNEQILIIAATNAPWQMDSALLRPGRFDRVIFVPPPDGPARSEILRLHLRGRPVSPEMDLASITQGSDGLSGADLADLVERGVEFPLREALQSGTIRPLSTADLHLAMDDARASTQDWFATARNYATFSNSGGLYKDLEAYMARQGAKPKKSKWWPF